ncbi:uncharacterized protein LOC127771470 [Oryza glaberrima]|uniref:uncharacterized protein LOC127771470 n=1 Tax=Oryza glaberrima TaxID=4538 RepID=UPI00224C3B52|nr:uncharacterized protein LOC127771470 [Oryza glaberrima]
MPPPLPLRSPPHRARLAHIAFLLEAAKREGGGRTEAAAAAVAVKAHGAWWRWWRLPPLARQGRRAEVWAALGGGQGSARRLDLALRPHGGGTWRRERLPTARRRTAGAGRRRWHSRSGARSKDIPGCTKFIKTGLRNEELLEKMFEDIRNTGANHWSLGQGTIPTAMDVFRDYLAGRIAG